MKVRRTFSLKVETIKILERLAKFSIFNKDLYRIMNKLLDRFIKKALLTLGRKSK